jgi:hypothetical protein
MKGSLSKEAEACNMGPRSTHAVKNQRRVSIHPARGYEHFDHGALWHATST